MALIVLTCSGVPASVGGQAAADIASEFRDHRTWSGVVRCSWDGTTLRLEAESEDESAVKALMDEFSDCLSAYVAPPFDGEIRLESTSPGASA